MKNKDENLKKVLALLYTGDAATDTIAFEIAKNIEIDETVVLALIAVALTCENQIFRRELAAFIAPQLMQSQKDFLLSRINSEYTDFKYLSYSTIKGAFSKKESFSILYTYFKRTGKVANELLFLDDGHHPERANIFNAFCEEHKRSGYLDLSGLLSEEIETYAQLVFANYPYHISLVTDGFQNRELPKCLYTRTYASVKIKETSSDFPHYIFQLKINDRLTLALHPNTIIPDDWSALSNLKRLDFNGSGYVFTDFRFVSTLPSLKELNITGNYIESPKVLLHSNKLPITSEIQFVGDKKDARTHRFVLPQVEAMQIVAALAKAILTEEEKEYYLYKMTTLRSLKEVKTFPLTELIALMNVNFNKLRTIVQQAINKQCILENSKTKWPKKTTFHFSGTPTYKKTALKENLKDLGFMYTDVPAKATHIVICKNPKNYKDVQDCNFKLVSESNIYALFNKENPGFIEEASSAGNTVITDNITTLLQSSDTQNIAVAIEMLKTGGVPLEMIDTLLVVFKTCPDSKLRGESKKLLLKNAPSFLLPLINDTQRFTSIETLKAQAVNIKLEKIAKNSSRELAAHLSLAFYQHYKKGLRYILYHFHEPSEIRTKALLALMEGTHFDFAIGLGFKNWKLIANFDDALLYNTPTKNKFPHDIVTLVPKVESVNFHNCKFNTVSAKIGNFQDLVKLDLSFNLIKKLPKSFAKLKNLEHLDLQMNSFEEFPEALLKLPNLKYLDLRHNRVGHVLQPVVLTDEIKNALKNCEILV